MIKSGQIVLFPFPQANLPVIVLDSHATVSKIGHAVLRALSASQSGFQEPPGPAELDDTMNHLFKAAEVQTFDQFQESILHCGVGRDISDIEITPAHIGGPHNVHFLLEEKIVLDMDAAPEQVGAAFLQGFTACTSIYR